MPDSGLCDGDTDDWGFDYRDIIRSLFDMGYLTEQGYKTYADDPSLTRQVQDRARRELLSKLLLWESGKMTLPQMLNWTSLTRDWLQYLDSLRPQTGVLDPHLVPIGIVDRDQVPDHLLEQFASIEE
jgi:hypothetical protein